MARNGERGPIMPIRFFVKIIMSKLFVKITFIKYSFTQTGLLDILNRTSLEKVPLAPEHDVAIIAIGHLRGRI